VYEVKKDQKVKLTSLEFEDCAMQWWDQTVMGTGLNDGIELFSFVIFGWWRKLGRIGGGSRPS